MFKTVTVMENSLNTIIETHVRANETSAFLYVSEFFRSCVMVVGGTQTKSGRNDVVSLQVLCQMNCLYDQFEK